MVAVFTDTVPAFTRSLPTMPLKVTVPAVRALPYTLPPPLMAPVSSLGSMVKLPAVLPVLATAKPLFKMLMPMPL